MTKAQYGGTTLRHVTFEEAVTRVTNAEERLRRVVGALAQKESVCPRTLETCVSD